MQEALDKLCEWARTWGMQFNEKKCKVMYVGHNTRQAYYMNGHQLERTETVHPQNVRFQNVRFQNVWFQNVWFQNIRFTKRQVYKTSGFKTSGFKTFSFKTSIEIKASIQPVLNFFTY
jgi:hypothetical protein